RSTAVKLRFMIDPVAKPANYTSREGPAPKLALSVEPALAGLRLDQALARLRPKESRSRLARLVEEGAVLVDGERVRPRHKLRGGEQVEVTLVPRPEESAFQPEEIALDVVHEDDDVLVVAKPAGLVVHPGSGNWAGTMLNALLHRVPALKGLPRAGIVHRLDKETSGLLVVAKHEAAMQDLVRQLQARTVKRTYLAIARGVMAGEGTVDAPIGRHPKQRTRMAVVPGGKPAVTHYRVRERFGAHALLECDLETGRTHQIRVHLASIGHPLEGDPVYGARGARRLPRQALHAWKLAFIHPGTGKMVRFTAPPPEDFEALVEALRSE
ncbi:MAG TPA: RluA family pseudouridine synthase, partial [Usitatibacteraceae bacterium]|nr:RluA family pseudouridine synthase [Usitatibacteraceae bacterium]